MHFPPKCTCGFNIVLTAFKAPHWKCTACNLLSRIYYSKSRVDCPKFLMFILPLKHSEYNSGRKINKPTWSEFFWKLLNDNGTFHPTQELVRIFDQQTILRSLQRTILPYMLAGPNLQIRRIWLQFKSFLSKLCPYIFANRISPVRRRVLWKFNATIRLDLHCLSKYLDVILKWRTFDWP